MSHYPVGCSASDVDRSSNGDAEYVDELDELCVLDCGHSGTIRNAEEAAGQLICEPCFIARKAFITELMGGLRSLAQ